MKLSFDLLPILVFAAVFKAAEAQLDNASASADGLLGLGVSGGSVGQPEAPVLLAAFAAALATLAQVAWRKLRRRHVGALLWFSLMVVFVLAGASVFFREPGLAKWKPSVLYWAIGMALWLSPLLSGRNLLRLLLGSRFALSDRVWHRLNFAWIAIFAMLGLLSLWVAYSVSAAAWADFKLGAGLAVLLLFTLGQELLLGRLAGNRSGADGNAAAQAK